MLVSAKDRWEPGEICSMICSINSTGSRCIDILAKLLLRCSRLLDVWVSEYGLEAFAMFVTFEGNSGRSERLTRFVWTRFVWPSEGDDHMQFLFTMH